MHVSRCTFVLLWIQATYASSKMLSNEEKWYSLQFAGMRSEVCKRGGRVGGDRAKNQEPKRTHKSQKSRTNRPKEFSEQFEALPGRYPVKQGLFWGKSHQKVHTNVRPNLCHTVSLWYLFCPPPPPQKTPKIAPPDSILLLPKRP